MQAAGGALRAVLPDQDAGEMGTLAIPTTIGLVAGRDDPRATNLAAHLASPEVERALIDAGFSAQSVRAGAADFRPMDVDYAEVARLLRPAIARATALLEGRADVPPLEPR